MQKNVVSASKIYKHKKFNLRPCKIVMSNVHHLLELNDTIQLFNDM